MPLTSVESIQIAEELAVKARKPFQSVDGSLKDKKGNHIRAALRHKNRKFSSEIGFMSP